MKEPYDRTELGVLKKEQGGQGEMGEQQEMRPEGQPGGVVGTSNYILCNGKPWDIECQM